MGSGEAIEELLAGARKAHLTSPASGAFIALGNAQSRARTGKDTAEDEATQHSLPRRAVELISPRPRGRWRTCLT